MLVRPFRPPATEEHPLDPSEPDPPVSVPAATESTERPTASTRSPWLLLLGAGIGLALATFGLLEEQTDGQALPSDAAARVGDRTIRRVDYERVLMGVESDLRGPIDEAMRRRVLDRMIDEELLVQRAIDLGLAVIDRRVRGELTSGLIDSIVSEADAEEPSDREVARHFSENVDFFTRPGRLRARTIFFARRPSPARSANGGPNDLEGDSRNVSAEIRARQAAERLAGGESAAEVEAALGNPQVSPIPNVLLPASKIRDYVGPTLLQTIESLEVGAWSEPVESGTGIHLAQLVEREPAIVPRIEDVADLVRQDLKRRRGDDALRRYLDDLRAETPVAIDESVFLIETD